MFQNNLKIAFRSLWNQKGFSTLNILGLAVSLTTALFMLLWVKDERSYDAFHAGGDRIHTVMVNLKQGNGSIDTWMGVPYPLIELLTSRYPEIELAAAYEHPNERYLKVGDKTFIEKGVFGTPTLFEMFSFPFVKSTWRETFSQPASVAVSESLAERLYGKDWTTLIPGAVLDIDSKNYTLTGVFKDIPANSSFRFDYVLNLDERMKNRSKDEFPWGNFDKVTFFRLAKGTSAEALTTKIAKAIHDNHPNKPDIDIWLHPLEKMYLHSNFENGKPAGGRIEYVRIFGAATLFLLLIACINFMNLATAQASRRAKEVGVRKTIGASRNSLIFKFMSEATLITFVSVGLAVLLAEMLLPQFRMVTGKDLQLDYGDPAFWGMLAGIFCVTSLMAGSYPAFFLSSFSANQVLKSGAATLKSEGSGVSLRQALVVFQFMLSGLLIICAAVVYQQIQYIQTKNLGLDRENIIHFASGVLSDKFNTFRTEALRNSAIKYVSPVSGNPLDAGMETGDPEWEGKREDQSGLFKIINTDHDFLSTFGARLSQGRNFSKDMHTDSMAYLVNQTAVNFMGMEAPLGKRLKFWGQSGPIIGVVEDFHVSSLHLPITPTIIRIEPMGTWSAFARIEGNKTEEAIAHLESTFREIAPGIPFQYDFLDATFRKAYQTETRTGKLAGVFALLAVFISCLGLFGLTAFTVEARTKEIGIRKVLGATTAGIVGLLSKDFLKLVVVALVIASPLAYFFMEKWLEDFAYRIDIQWTVFALAGLAAAAAAFLTVSFQSMKAALANPVKSLRSE